VSDDLSQDGGPLPEGAARYGLQGYEPGDAVDNEPVIRHLRRPPNFRGHIVVDDDEPLLVFDAPAEPPPASPPAPEGTATQG